jgi:tetratricopeptide (TPR) repeat protein
MQFRTVRLAFPWRIKRSQGRVASVLSILLLTSLASMSQLSRAQDEPYARAEALVRDHEWNEGLSVLGELLEHSPDNLKALNLTGLALIGKGDTKAANKYFNRALAINPRFAPALKNLSINEFDAQDYAAANKHLEVAESVTPKDPMIHFYLGNTSKPLTSSSKSINCQCEIRQRARTKSSATCV